MKKTSQKTNIIRIKKGLKEKLTDFIAIEAALTIFINGTELVTLLCTPGDFKALAVGYLYSEGFINKITDIKGLGFRKNNLVYIRTEHPVDFNKEVFLKRVLASGCGKAAVFYSEADSGSYKTIKNNVQVPVPQILEQIKELGQKGVLYKKTGAVHIAALSDTQKILILKEDIGRHNAVDKVLGQALIDKKRLNKRMILTSGRITSEIVRKTLRHQIPILVSPSAPTDLALRLAQDFGLTLIGFARGSRLNVYTHPQRVVL
ncbi:MAG: formate dehydrogenase accessory sulfurtransferase FdhD [Candidatus Omnitrophica bacterium]|nr:formate dehydrogenase accessory sulfurtransferase FdhD [Candidatus Omnitrophota bacterium]